MRFVRDQVRSCPNPDEIDVYRPPTSPEPPSRHVAGARSIRIRLLCCAVGLWRSQESSRTSRENAKGTEPPSGDLLLPALHAAPASEERERERERASTSSGMEEDGGGRKQETTTAAAASKAQREAAAAGVSVHEWLQHVKASFLGLVYIYICDVSLAHLLRDEPLLNTYGDVRAFSGGQGDGEERAGGGGGGHARGQGAGGGDRRGGGQEEAARGWMTHDRRCRINPKTTSSSLSNGAIVKKKKYYYYYYYY